MSSRKIRLKMENLTLDATDELIRWALEDEIADEEPSPQVWQNIRARVMAHSQTLFEQSAVRRPWQEFTSRLQAWPFGFAAASDRNRHSHLTPREHAYLVWRENLLLSIIPLTTTMAH